MRAGLVLIAALVLAGCGTTERHGGLGDALKGDHMQAKVLRFVPTVPERKLGHDVTGLNAPGAGMRFAAADLALCNDTGAAALPWRFELRLDDGSSVHPHQPTSVYADALEPVRDGCDQGWVVWEVPSGAQAKSLYFEFDYSHQTANGSSYRDDEHDRFHWAL
jgi:hypothetical protein